MKKIFLLLAILVTIISCDSGRQESLELENLKNQISYLENQNKKLRDSLDQVEEMFLLSQIVIAIPDDEFLIVGKENNIPLLFQTYNTKLPVYDVFVIENDKQIRVGSGDNTRFDFNYTPKSLNDNEVEMLIKMPYKDQIFEFPVGFWFRVKE